MNRQQLGMWALGLLLVLLLAGGIATDHVTTGGELPAALNWLTSRWIATTVPVALVVLFLTGLLKLFLPGKESGNESGS